jgi:hypothetical protein
MKSMTVSTYTIKNLSFPHSSFSRADCAKGLPVNAKSF